MIVSSCGIVGLNMVFLEVGLQLIIVCCALIVLADIGDGLLADIGAEEMEFLS